MQRLRFVLIIVIIGSGLVRAQRSNDLTVQEKTARATAAALMEMVNSPELQRAQAQVREAEAPAYGRDIQIAAVRLDTLELDVTTREIRDLETKVDRARTDLIGSARNLEAMSADLAKLLTDLETARNNAITPELAEARVRLATLRDLALTDDLERARNRVESMTTAAVRALASLQVVQGGPTSQSVLEAASTPQLEESRRRRDELMRAAAASNPDVAKAKAHVEEVKARVGK